MNKPYYQNGLITIYHGDSREIAANIQRGVTITDPPYNIGYHYQTYRDNLSTEEYQELLRAVCPAPCVIIHYAEDLCAISWTLEELPEKIVAWVYNSNTPRQWRGIAWFGARPDFKMDNQPYKNPKDKRIAARINAGKSARLYDWWEINQVKNVGVEKTDHPCQVPLEVVRRIIKITESEIIIDPFCGSGTTLAAAKELGRKAIGIELDEKYCEIAARRLDNQQPQLFNLHEVTL